MEIHSESIFLSGAGLCITCRFSSDLPSRSPAVVPRMALHGGQLKRVTSARVGLSAECVRLGGPGGEVRHGSFLTPL